MSQVLMVNSSGQRLGQLDAEVDAVSWTLNGSTDTTVQVDPENPALGAGVAGFGYDDVYRDNYGIEEEDDRFRFGGAVELQVWDDAGLLWWGVPLGVGSVGPTGMMDITCGNLEAHFGSRLVVADLRYDQIDQLIIGQRLVEHAQAVPPQSGDADLRIAIANFPLSGVLRDRGYPADERSGIAHLLELLSGVRGSFDWTVEYTGDGRREWTPHYPTRGPVRDTLTWDVHGARGIVDWSASVDGQTVNEAHVSGDAPDEDEGGARPYGYAVDRDARLRDGLRQLVESGSDGTTDQRTLDDRAERIVAERRDPRSDVRFTLESTDVVAARTVRPGDRFALELRRGVFRFVGIVKAETVTYRLTTGLAEVEGVVWTP